MYTHTPTESENTLALEAAVMRGLTLLSPLILGSGTGEKVTLLFLEDGQALNDDDDDVFLLGTTPEDLGSSIGASGLGLLLLVDILS